MKKLTKTLSLVLVIAMVLSLCVVGVSAKTFCKDGDQIGDAYKEAVDVMSGIGIISGVDTEGTTFNPTGNFTRAEAAKIIAYMVLGKDAGDALAKTAGASMFKDMGGYAWAVPYVNYCATKGIINGTGDGNFAPAAKLTGYAFAKMLLCAVGYGANKEYTGTGWDLKVATDAVTLGVFKGDMTGATKETINREQAVLYAFNTLTGIGKVSYSALYGTYVQVGGDTLTTLTSRTLGWSMYGLWCTKNNYKGYLPVAWEKATASGSTKTTYCIANIAVTADKENLGHLGYVWCTEDSATDFDTAVSSVYYAEKVLGTNVTGKSIADLSDPTNAAYISKTNDPTYVVNGEVLADTATSYYPVLNAVGSPAANGYYEATTTAGVTTYAKSVATSVVSGTTYYVLGAAADAAQYIKMGAKVTFVDVKNYSSNMFDGKAEYIYISTASTYVVAGPTSTVKATDATYVVIPGVISYVAGATSGNVDTDSCVGYEGLVKGDVVNVSTWANGMTYVEKAKTVVGKLTNITRQTSGAVTFTVDGTTDPVYANAAGDWINTLPVADYSKITGIASSDLNTSVTLYLDQCGFAVGYLPSVISNYQVAYVIGIDPSTAYGTYAISAKLLLPDGTTKTANVYTVNGNKVAACADSTAFDNMKGSVAGLVKYAETDNGLELTPVGGTLGSADSYKNGATTLTTHKGYVVDSKTIAYVYDTTTYTYKAYVGAANIPSLNSTTPIVFTSGTTGTDAGLVYAMFFGTTTDTSTVTRYYGVVTAVDTSKAASNVYSVSVWNGTETKTYVQSNYGTGTGLCMPNPMNVIEYTVNTDGKITATVLNDSSTFVSSGKTYGVTATSIALVGTDNYVNDGTNTLAQGAGIKAYIVNTALKTYGETTVQALDPTAASPIANYAFVIYNMNADGTPASVAQIWYVK